MEISTHRSADRIAETEKQEALARPSARAGKSEPLTHVHPQGYHDVCIGTDEQGRRIIREMPSRKPTYMTTCAACVAEEETRMAAPPNLKHLETTLFLVPEQEYAGMVARAYLRQRYPTAQNVASSFSAEKLSYVPNAQIVVLSRRGKNGKMPGPRSVRKKDEEDTFYDAPIDPETYIHEIVESAPIVIADCITVSAGTMYSEQSADFTELMERLAEHAAPFRIAHPIAPDKVYVMRLNA